MIEECTHAACSGRRLAQATTTNDACRAVVSDLVSLIEHARNGLRLMIAAEIPLVSPESSINVIVLDDVSPRYMKAAAADPLERTMSARRKLASGISRPAEAHRILPASGSGPCPACEKVVDIRQALCAAREC